MINQVNINNIKQTNARTSPFLSAYIQKQKPDSFEIQKTVSAQNVLNSEDRKKYDELINFMADYPISNATNRTIKEKMEALLQNGKLTSRDSNDGSSTLENLYEIISTQRTEGLDKKVIISDILDDLYKPSIINQHFGDIPEKNRQTIISQISKKELDRINGSSIDVLYSGTCPAASCEVNMADKYPAEFTRWVSKLSSQNKDLSSKINWDSLSKNKLDIIKILLYVRPKIKSFNTKTINFEIQADEGAYLRAQNQTKNWDKDERNTADVLIQSAVMNLGSSNTYDSLTDIRKPRSKYDNNQGLNSDEKTFVETVIKNKEITSMPYQILDKQNYISGYTFDFKKIEEQMKKALDNGEDIIVGITNARKNDNNSTEIQDVNGHEITITGYETDSNNDTIFHIIDTDDNTDEIIKEKAQTLIPQLHHAGYSSGFVENDIKQLNKAV